ncbi:sialic acid-binding Ig-like lectin 10 [Hemiscyllium ocellatum]|uniref:sialic acid-binding Ig-like lectin 10 n=1 Tax=Hemiscyllium ocellatum TaxID=170820 RepID=UPI0029666925|nr:sialic acid-binding Ig-like lectin 10 [Hemiscyllium ocellatum]
MSDSNYTCVVKVPTTYPPIEEKGPGTQLHVVVPPSPPAISVTQETLVAEKTSSLYCLAGRFYPQSISIKWLQAILDNSQSSPADAETRYRTQEFTFSNMDGTFNTTSQLTFVPTSQDHGLIYTCQVNHSTNEKQIIKQIRLKVNYGPKLVIYYRTSDTDMFHRLDQDHIHVKHQTFLELNCTADSNPVATVIWKKISQEQSLQLAAGVNISMLKIASIEYSDSGAYLCGAQNDYGFQEFPVNIYLKSDLGSKCKSECSSLYEYSVQNKLRYE